MKLTQTQLAQHLTKTLAPLYLISGDEFLLVQETIETILAAAQHQGFSERTTITPESGTDWKKLIYPETHTISLFSAKRVIQFNASNAKFNATNGKALEAYALKPAPETILIVQSPKLESSIEKTAWYQSVIKHGVVIPVWPISSEQLPGWIMQRSKKYRITLSKEAALWLATQMEGNLLALDQEMEKLALLKPDGTVDRKMLESACTDNAHFDIFNLVDSALLGHTERSLRILDNLAAEDTEPTLVLWALTRELRMLSDIHTGLSEGASLPQLFAKFRLWEKRQPAVNACLRRHKRTKLWDLLLTASTIDHIIKGNQPGNPWDELQKLVIGISHNAIISI